MANVNYVVSAETASAVDGFLKLVAAQNKSADASKEGKKHADSHHESMFNVKKMADEVMHSATSMITAFLGVETVIELFKSLEEHLKKVDEANRHFQESSKGGASLPAYIKNSSDFRERSYNLSETYGVDVDVVNKLREKIGVKEAGRSVKDKELFEQTALQYHQLTGAAPEQVADVMRRTLDAHPEMQIREAQSNTRWLQETGRLQLDEQLAMGEKLNPVFSGMNVSVENQDAIMALIGQAGGSEKLMGKGLMSLLNKMPDLQKKGIVSHGDDVMANLQDLADSAEKDPDKFNAAVGDLGVGKMPAAVAKFFGQHGGELKSLSASAGQAMHKDLVGGELEYMSQHDQRFNIGESSARAEQVDKNKEGHVKLDEVIHAEHLRDTYTGIEAANRGSWRQYLPGFVQTGLVFGLHQNRKFQEAGHAINNPDMPDNERTDWQSQTDQFRSYAHDIPAADGAGFNAQFGAANQAFNTGHREEAFEMMKELIGAMKGAAENLHAAGDHLQSGPPPDGRNKHT